MIAIKEINDIEEIVTYKENWDKIVNNNNDSTVFQQYDFIKTWFKVYGKNFGCKILVVTDESNDECLGFIPFYVNKNKGLRKLRLMGDSFSDYSQLILENHSSDGGKIFSNYLRDKKDWDYLCINSYPEGTLTDTIIKNISSKYFLCQHKKQNSSYHLKLNSQWEIFYNNLDQRFRRDTERQIKRISNISEWYIEKINGAQIISELEHFFYLHIKRWKKSDKKTLFEIDINKEFFKQLTIIFDSLGILHFSKMMIGNEIAAMHLGFIYKDRYYYYIPVFNKEYFQYSVGRIYLLELIKESYSLGLKVFDLMAGNENYKSSFGCESVNLSKVYIFPRNFLGKVLSLIKKIN